MTLYKGTQPIAGLGKNGKDGISLICGQTIFSLDPLTNAGLHLLDGTVLPVGGSYDDFITNYIIPLYTAHPERFKTEAEWQAIYAEKGICDYYVYTAGTSVRLPKLGNKLYDTDITDVAVVGNGMTLGITDGVEEISLSHSVYTFSHAYYSKDSGALVGVAPSTTLTGDAKTVGVTTDSTKSGIIAKTSNIEATTGYWYIVVSTVTKTDIEGNIDRIQTDLNNKADKDLTNITNTAKSMVSGLGMPSDRYIDLTLGASGTEYTAPANGWVSFKGTSSADISQIYVQNVTKNIETTDTFKGLSVGQDIAGYVPVIKNDTFKVVFYNFNKTIFRFIYADGEPNE